MAGSIFVANTTAETALASSSGKVMISLTPPSSIAIKIKEWGVFFDGISVTAEPILVRLVFTNTSFGSYTTHVPTRRVGNQLLSQCVVLTMDGSCGYSGDSSGTVAIREVHPQSGYQEKFSYGDEPIIYQKTIHLTVNSPSTCDCAAELVYEE